MPKTIVSISLPFVRKSFSNRATSSTALHTDAILTISAPKRTHFA